MSEIEQWDYPTILDVIFVLQMKQDFEGAYNELHKEEMDLEIKQIQNNNKNKR